MIKEFFMKDTIKKDFLIVLFFLVISILSGIMLFRSGYYPMNYDFDFHWQRIYELKESIIHMNFDPLFALNGFNQTGTAVMGMYPKINIYPIVILSFFVKSYSALVNIMFIVRNFFALIIAYYSCYRYRKDRMLGFVFAISYTLTTMSLYYCIGVYGIGTSTSMIFLPMILFGFLSLMKNNSWIELSIGVTVIFLSHILSFGITIIFIISLIIFHFKVFFKTKKIVAMIKAVVVTVLCTSVFWIPFFYISLKNKMGIPNGDKLVGNDFSYLISAPLNNSISSTLTLVGLAGLVLGIVYYKEMTIEMKKLFFISIIFLIICSQLFPWNMLNHTIVSHLQFPNRVYIIPQLLLCYIFTELMLILMNRFQKTTFVLVLFVLSIIGLQISAQKEIIDGTYNNPRLTYLYNGNTNVKLQNNTDFNNIINSEFLGNNDYYLQSSYSKYYEINNRMAFDNKGNHIPVKTLGNGLFSFKVNSKKNQLVLPVMKYIGFDYAVKLDGNDKNIIYNKNHLLEITNVSKGNHIVKVIIKKSFAEILSYVLTIIGLIVLILSLIRKYIFIK